MRRSGALVRSSSRTSGVREGEQTAASANELAANAVHLNRLVGHFQVNLDSDGRSQQARPQPAGRQRTPRSSKARNLVV